MQFGTELPSLGEQAQLPPLAHGDLKELFYSLFPSPGHNSPPHQGQQQEQGGQQVGEPGVEQVIEAGEQD